MVDLSGEGEKREGPRSSHGRRERVLRRTRLPCPRRRPASPTADFCHTGHIRRTGTSPRLLPSDVDVVSRIFLALGSLLVLAEHAVASYELPILGRGPSNTISWYKHNFRHLWWCQALDLAADCSERTGKRLLSQRRQRCGTVWGTGERVMLGGSLLYGESKEERHRCVGRPTGPGISQADRCDVPPSCMFRVSEPDLLPTIVFPIRKHSRRWPTHWSADMSGEPGVGDNP